MSDTPATGEAARGLDLDAIERAARAATPGPWESDCERGEGSYGSGPNCSEGYDEYFVCATEQPLYYGKVRRIADMSCESTEVHQDYDEDGGSAWDEIGKRNAVFIAALNPSVALALIARLRYAEAARDAALARVKVLEATVAAFKRNRDPCPFSRTDCALEPEEPCPVCGDLGTFDRENMDRPVRCVSSGETRLLAGKDGADG